MVREDHYDGGTTGRTKRYMAGRSRPQILILWIKSEDDRSVQLPVASAIRDNFGDMVDAK